MSQADALDRPLDQPAVASGLPGVKGQSSRQAMVRAVVAYGGAAVLAALAAAWVLKLWHADLSVPMYYQGDCLLVHTWIKGLVDNPWYLHNPRIGMPSGLDMHDFP